MLKSEEISNPKSCLNSALDTEFVFVLQGRDIASPGAIRFWVSERIRLGKNLPEDMQIQSALEIAREMDAQQKEIHALAKGGVGNV